MKVKVIFPFFTITIYELLCFFVKPYNKSIIQTFNIFNINELRNIIFRVLLYLIFFSVIWIVEVSLSKKQNNVVNSFIKSNTVTFVVLILIRMLIDFIIYSIDYFFSNIEEVLPSIDLLFDLLFIMISYLIINKKIGNKNQFNAKSRIIVFATIALSLFLYYVISQILNKDMGLISNTYELDWYNMMLMMSDNTLTLKLEISKMIIYIVFQFVLIYCFISNYNKQIFNNKIG